MTSRRWIEQRWLVDQAIACSGIEFDQHRLGYYLGPVADALVAADRSAIATGVRSLADITPVVAARAAHRDQLADAAESAGRIHTAGSHRFAAAMLWEMAQWPCWRTDDALRELDRRKNLAYRAWAATASHDVHELEIPTAGGRLPAHLHVPRGVTRPPVVLAIPGMDAGRVTLVDRVGDGVLSQGVAVLAVDGPGQHEAAIRGIHTTPQAWADLGPEIVAALRARSEVDASRIVVTGTSFGSWFATAMVAHAPELFAGLAVALPVFEPGVRTIFTEAAPSYRERHMWMAGLDDDRAFDALCEGYDLRGVVERLDLPWLTVCGGADELSPTGWVDALTARAPGPTAVLRYEGARHDLGGSPAGILGPPWQNEMSDWLTATALTTAPSLPPLRTVDRAGRVHDDGRHESTDPVAPSDVRRSA